MGRPRQEILVRRFWNQVEIGAADECWLWQGHVSWNGYGIRYWNKRDQVVHRIAYQLSGGVIPDGLLLRHKCDVKLCCNPAHHVPGTHADNMRDMTDRNRAARIFGEANIHSTLTDDQVLIIVLMRFIGRPCRQIAAVFGISNQYVSKLATGKSRNGGLARTK